MIVSKPLYNCLLSMKVVSTVLSLTPLPLPRSVLENSTRNSSSMAVKMTSRGGRGPTGVGQTIVVNLPYIRSDIPILVLFRALGFVADKDILQHIVYDFEDTEMMEALRPSIEEAFPIQDQQVCLDSFLPHLQTHTPFTHPYTFVQSGRQRLPRHTLILA